MAQMLRDSDSSEKHLSTVRRHKRLCKGVKGADFLVSNIAPHDTRLNGAMANKKLAAENDEDTRDDRDLHGRIGADMIRTTAERAKQHDREVPGESAFARVFPEGGYSAFIGSNGAASATSCRIISARIGELGANHPLASLQADLEACAVAIDETHKHLADTLRARKLAEAEDELAQAALRRAYEDNWLDAQKKFGKTAAERLFPRIRKADTSGENEGEGT